MTFKTRVVLVSEDGKEWTVDRIDYAMSDIEPEKGESFAFGELGFIDSKYSPLDVGQVLQLKEEAVQKSE